MSTAQRPSASGLTGVELAVLRAVEECCASSAGPFARTGDVLERVDAWTGVGPRYAQRILRDLIVDWVRHLPLLDGDGNFGSIGGDEGADARYTQVRLAHVGELALAAERGEVGALPLDLIEGSLYRGGGFPPFDPATTIRALLVGAGSAGTPRTPTGTITPDATAPFRNNGRWVTRYQLGSVIRTGRDPDELVLTEPPYLRRHGHDRGEPARPHRAGAPPRDAPRRSDALRCTIRRAARDRAGQRCHGRDLGAHGHLGRPAAEEGRRHQRCRRLGAVGRAGHGPCRLRLI